MNRMLVIVVSGVAICAGFAAARALPQGAASRTELTGQAAFATAELERPGIFRHITVADLPAPFATPSATNQSKIVPRPANAWPQAPPGFKVQLFATGFDVPRELRTAPNGDIFLADSGPGEIKVLHGLTNDGKAESVTVFADRPASALRNRLLSAGSESAVRLRRQHQFRRALSLYATAI